MPRNYVEIEVRDAEGRLTESRGFESESYVIAFVDIFQGLLAQVVRTVTDTGGVARSAANNGMMDYTSPVSIASRGIVVGTGVAAVAITDTKLGTQIAEGTGATQMHHIAQEFTAPSTSGSTRSYTTTRAILNDSGAGITVNECGIYALHNAFNFCVIRYLVSPGILVANLGTIPIRYMIGVTAS